MDGKIRGRYCWVEKSVLWSYGLRQVMIILTMVCCWQVKNGINEGFLVCFSCLNSISRIHNFLLCDGIDVKDMDLTALRQNIGVVQQDVYIFNTSIKENIAYGTPGATMEEIVSAAKSANIHDYIMTLPDGYDTYIGERGVRFSGGQKQRISIARIFLKNPPVLILDEATAALDNESERYIQKSLDNLSKNRTTIIIAHRLSTVRNADEIIVLTDEGIVEDGTHETLMKQDGQYKMLYDMQFELL